YHTRLYCIHSLILIRSRLPPALFPYTTLFRSIGIDGHRGALTVGHPRGGVPVVRAAGTVRPGGTTRADDAGGQVEPSGGIHTRALDGHLLTIDEIRALRQRELDLVTGRRGGDGPHRKPRARGEGTQGDDGGGTTQMQALTVHQFSRLEVPLQGRLAYPKN